MKKSTRYILGAIDVILLALIILAVCWPGTDAKIESLSAALTLTPDDASIIIVLPDASWSDIQKDDYVHRQLSYYGGIESIKITGITLVRRGD